MEAMFAGGDLPVEQVIALRKRLGSCKSRLKLAR